jgi:lipopolysaccharide export system ATP-binding protein
VPADEGAMSEAELPTLPPRLAELAHGDRSLALAMAALVDGADTDGASTINDIAIRFRETYLGVEAIEGHDVEREAGRLGLDEVRAYLITSVLPRLAEDGLVVPMGDRRGDPEALVAVAPVLWGTLARNRRASARALRASGALPIEALSVEPAVDTSSVLEATGLVKIYRRRKVVNDVALRLQQGEIVGLLGPNGAGKTTTFYMIVGLIPPLEGTIRLDGVDITQMPMYRRARQGIGYLSQEPSIFRKLTVEENILAILEMLPMSNADRQARLEQLLDELSIKHLRQSKAYALSGGERRRLEITRALVTSPKFMMLDEPFAGVDPIAVHDIQTIVAGLRHRGIGVLISDHNVEQTLDIVDRAYIMFDGQVKISGTVRELVYDETVAEVYLGPTLTARLRARYSAA